MSVSMAIFTFLNAWFITLFFVLPFYIRPADKPAPQEYAAAPKAVRWKRALFINTMLSILATGALALLIHSHLVDVSTT